MLLPLTIQFHIIVALLASKCGGTMLGALEPERDIHVIAVLADVAVASDHIDTDPTDPDGPSGDGILLDVAVWTHWLNSDTLDNGQSLSIGDAARRWLQSRAPPVQREA